MHEFAESLATAVREARNRLGKTQSELSELIDASPRTILNIENREANPKLHILFPLIRSLNIDPSDIFYPEREVSASAKKCLHAEIDRLNEEEAALLAETIHALIEMTKTKSGVYFGPEEQKSGPKQ